MNQITACRGTTLVELLISLLILSVGVFAMLGLQLTSLKNGRNAYFQTQTFYSAQAMAEELLISPVASEEVMTAWSDELGLRVPASASILCTDTTPEDGVPESPACDGDETSAPTVLKVWWSENTVASSQARLSWVVKAD